MDVEFNQKVLSDLKNSDGTTLEEISENLKNHCDRIISNLEKEKKWLDSDLYGQIDLARDTLFQFARSIDERGQSPMEGIERPGYDKTVEKLEITINALSEFKLPE